MRMSVMADVPVRKRVRVMVPPRLDAAMESPQPVGHAETDEQESRDALEPPAERLEESEPEEDAAQAKDAPTR